MSQIANFERAALTAFRYGQGWSAFGNSMPSSPAVETCNTRRFRRLYNRLLSLVTNGDACMMIQVSDALAPWEADDTHFLSSQREDGM